MKSIFKTLSAPIRSITAERPEKVSVSLSSIQDEEQIDKLVEFKQAVKSLEIPNDLELDEFYYMKWLRARGYNISKAKEMLQKHLEWRESCTYLHGIMNYIAPNDILNNMKWKNLGTDTYGRPIICVLLGRFDAEMLYTNDGLEYSKRYVHKMFEIFQSESDKQGRLTGYGKVIGIIDMDGMTLAKAMNIHVIQLAIYFARVFEANYPEFLHRIFVLNANWFFTTVYNIMKNFFAQETVEKIQVYGFVQAKYLPALEEKIPLELIPEEYGGPGSSIEEFDINP